MSLENTKQFPKLKPKLEGWQNGAMQQQFVRQGHNTLQPSDIKCFWQIIDHCCQGDKLLFFLPSLAVSFIHLMSKQAQLSDVSRRNSTKSRVWLLNNGKVIRGMGALSAKACGNRTYRWSTNLDRVNNQGKQKQCKKNTEKTLEKSYLDALLWVDPSSSCFLLLVFIVQWSG